MLKPGSILTAILIIVSGCGSDPKSIEKNTNNKSMLVKLEDVDWSGTWSFNDGYVDYTLTISEDYGGHHACQYEATGIQTYYVLECVGVIKDNSIQLKFPVVKDGDFLQQDRIIKEEPILTLTMKDRKVITYWNQLANNYEGNHNGELCFKKQEKQSKTSEKENFDEIIERLRKRDSFNQSASWEKRGLSQSDGYVLSILNNAKSVFLKEIQAIKNKCHSDKERLVNLNKLVDNLPWDELDTEEREFMADELAPAIEALGFDPVMIF
jgi:hypothetical protein